ncbi:hypothetical protein ACU6TU_08430 [Halomonas sp. LS-001]
MARNFLSITVAGTSNPDEDGFIPNETTYTCPPGKAAKVIVRKMATSIESPFGLFESVDGDQHPSPFIIAPSEVVKLISRDLSTGNILVIEDDI